MTAFNMQNYYIGELTESDDDANQFWFRYAKPFSVGESNWLLRASLPINTFPTPPIGDKETGIGDLNIFAAYLIDTGNPAVSFGIGPQLTAPTATKNELGNEKWSAGLVNVLFNGSSAKFQYGYLLSWQGSFAGDVIGEEAAGNTTARAFLAASGSPLFLGPNSRRWTAWYIPGGGDRYAVATRSAGWLGSMAFTRANRLVAVSHRIDERAQLKDQIQAIVTVLSLVNPAICGMLFARVQAGRPPGSQLLDATKAAFAILAILVGAAGS